MLRVAGLSLLLGFTALVVVLTQFFSPSGAAPGTSPIVGNESNIQLNGAAPGMVDGAMQLDLGRLGGGFITLLTGGVDAADYAFLHLAVDDPPQDLVTSIHLNFKGGASPVQLHELPNRSPTSLWLAMDELQGWTGTINSVTLFFNGSANEVIRIRKFALYPSTPLRQLQSIYSDLTGNAPWRRADMNTHTGVAKSSSFYPVPLAVSLFLLSFFAYGVMLVLLKKRLEFDWTIVGLLFLACWVTLDLTWQNRMFYQVGHSYHLFAGRDSPEKLAVGPDRKLYNFVSAAKEYIEPDNARVFVASSDLYRGMRGAYYLYPFNAFWRLEPPELPHNEYLRKGDYILMIKPVETRYWKTGKITSPQHSSRKAERIYSDNAGTLVRLK